MLNSLTDEVIEALKFKSLSPLIVTVGNSFRSDDGVGCYIASKLMKHHIPMMDAGDKPENIVDEVIRIKPDRILILDAANFGGVPGEVRLISENSISEFTLSTHMVPINVVAKIIASAIATTIVFVGIQPKTVALGEGLSEEVRNAADEIIRFIRKAY